MQVLWAVAVNYFLAIALVGAIICYGITRRNLADEQHAFDALKEDYDILIKSDDHWINVATGHAIERDALRDALMEIASMATPNMAHIGTRMSRVAMDALEDLGVPDQFERISNASEQQRY